MSDVSTGGDAGSEGIPAHVPGGTEDLSAREAARSLTDWRNKRMAAANAPEQPASQPKPEPPVSQPERAPAAPAADESAPAADADSPEETPGETQKAEPSPEGPLLEPPDSWTADAKSKWQSLPRDTQEYLTQREQDQAREVRRVQAETAKQLEGLSAREQAMEQQRLQMEAVTIEKAKALQKVLQRDFSDIQSFEDVKKMAEEDWARYNRWNVFQQELAVENTQAQEAQRRQVEAQQSAFIKFAQEQDKKFVERVPEFADKEKSKELQDAAVKTLENIGFGRDELNRLWHGQEAISLRDARLQEAFYKAAKYDRAQEAAKKAVVNKTLPPVQRPGVAQQGNSHEQEIRALEKRINNSRGNEQLRLLTERKRLLGER